MAKARPMGSGGAMLSYDDGDVGMSFDLALTQVTELASGRLCPVALKQGRGMDCW